jgi:hypothetical protein
MIPVLGGVEEGGISWVDEAEVQARAARFDRSADRRLGRILSRRRSEFPLPQPVKGWAAYYLNAFLAAIAAR